MIKQLIKTIHNKLIHNKPKYYIIYFGRPYRNIDIAGERLGKAVQRIKQMIDEEVEDEV
jgi:hypothetical protein